MSRATASEKNLGPVASAAPETRMGRWTTTAPPTFGGRFRRERAIDLHAGPGPGRPPRAGGVPPPGVRRRRPPAGASRGLDPRPPVGRSFRAGQGARPRTSSLPRTCLHVPNARARSSARTSCWKRSARAASASSSWPSSSSPVRRKVALKIIKPGMDTRQVIARFEAERQALALMDHPNIAHGLRWRRNAAAAGPTSSWSWSAASRSPSSATRIT